MSLEHVLRDPRLWRYGREAPAPAETIPTGHAVLDALLPGGGWPRGALTEVLSEAEGIGALRLILPALARLSRFPQWLAWIAPPHLPYAPALAARGLDLRRVLIVTDCDHSQSLWAMEQSLRAGACSAVLGWPRGLDDRGLRRLQLAAETGRCWGLVFRPLTAARAASPAALRLALEPHGPRLAVRIIKCRGGVEARSVCLDLGD
ncbi:MAG: translesion DNA synthesis-associated protein ImuA [Gammaproteobacteria bacterium]